jgi:hypothetical protein
MSWPISRRPFTTAESPLDICTRSSICRALVPIQADHFDPPADARGPNSTRASKLIDQPAHQACPARLTGRPAAGDLIDQRALQAPRCPAGDKRRCTAYFRPVDGTPEMLCAIDLSAYTNHPHIRDLFIELATEVAINRDCEPGNSVTLRPRQPLPRTNSSHPL